MLNDNAFIYPLYDRQTYKLKGLYPLDPMIVLYRWKIALFQAKCVRDILKIKIDLVDPFPLCFVDECNRDIVVPCKCGKTDINISGNGDVSRCGADPNYQLGNIFITPIEEIWNKPELIAFRNRDYLPQECANCERKLICGGGCPMSVLAYKSKNKSHLDMFRKKIEFSK